MSNRLIPSALLCFALLGRVFIAHAAGTEAASASAKTASRPMENPIPAPPVASPGVQRILSAMNVTSTWGHPDLFGEFAGMRLYSSGHYKAAMKYFKYGARFADKLSQLSIGLMYANGRGVKKDPVTACAWLALAAQRKFPSFIATRDRVCKELTPEQHEEAVAVLDKLLPDYGDKVAKKRMARALNMAMTEGTGSWLGFDSGANQVAATADCSGRTMSEGGVTYPRAGCGDPHFYDPARWDPKKYFAARDARWRGVVTVGALQNPAVPKSSSVIKKSASKNQPTSASSAGH
jgi:hypothetical protein